MVQLCKCCMVSASQSSMRIHITFLVVCICFFIYKYLKSHHIILSLSLPTISFYKDIIYKDIFYLSTVIHIYLQTKRCYSKYTWKSITLPQLFSTLFHLPPLIDLSIVPSIPTAFSLSLSLQDFQTEWEFNSRSSRYNTILREKGHPEKLYLPCRRTPQKAPPMPATMQHVTSFFRAHSHPFDLPTEGKKGPRRSSSSRPALNNRTPSSSTSSITDDKAGKMPDHSLSHKRISIPGLHTPKSSSKSIPQYHAATLGCAIESPPLLLYGSTSASTGALLSGQLKLNIHDEKFAIESFKMRLAVEVTQKKPYHAHCQECSHQSTDLTTWNFLHGPATLRKGMYWYMLRHLFIVNILIHFL